MLQMLFTQYLGRINKYFTLLKDEAFAFVMMHQELANVNITFSKQYFMVEDKILYTLQFVVLCLDHIFQD